MIPLNASEAADALRHQERLIAQSRRQIAHFGLLKANEEKRLARFEAEAEMLRAPSPGDAGTDRTEGRLR